MNPVETLAALAGTWRGLNTLHDPHTGEPEGSPSTVSVTPLLGGRFVRIDYDWAYQGKPQEGSLLVGFASESGAVSVHWTDTWHMGRIALNCVGEATTNGGLDVRGSYAAPPGPDWGWRIEIGPEGDSLRIAHTNFDPDGKPYPAVLAVYTRPEGPSFKSAGAIGDTDLDALPVKEIGPAVGFYTQCLGFALVSKGPNAARLKRDDVEIGLAVNGQDPEQASCWFSVDDVDALRRELEAKGMEPGTISEQVHGGKPYRVFFAKEPYGVCFCFTQPLN